VSFRNVFSWVPPTFVWVFPRIPGDVSHGMKYEAPSKNVQEKIAMPIYIYIYVYVYTPGELPCTWYGDTRGIF